MRLYLLLAAIALTVPVALTGCASDASINQLPAPVRATVEREIGPTGKVQDIDAETRNGVMYYEIEYEKAGESFEMNVTEDGKIHRKVED